MEKDTLKDEPVETLEDDISAVLDAAESEATDERDDTNTTETAEIESEGGDDIGDVSGDESDTSAEPITADEADQRADDDADTGEDDDEAADDLAASEEAETDKLEAPEHWSAVDRETFNEQPKAAQEFILKRHKEIEGDYTRKRQQESSQVRLAEAVTDALNPHRQDFESAGLDEAGAVRKLLAVHGMLKTGDKSAILNLAQTYGIDMDEEGQEYVDPALRQTQSQLSSIEQRIARQEQAAQHQEHSAILATIKQFEEAKDANGKLLHPHFREVQEEISSLMYAGIARKDDLEDGYKKAMALRPDLKPAEKKAEPNISRAEKVAKAKKAATGIRSSGAVGKTPAKAMSLEDEIAAQIP